ncbi:MAG: fumarylacetoacetate hydrolase family protein [Bacteroidales bacterium]|nr:fumarylacetoacetate hydrolase family protein [Bacteroidales bacterium]MBR3540265.1 fumarylacetoacetate hydrolase family protein [Bacteroidales bacterium]
MKIICVGMNYAKHNEELKHTLTQIQGVKVGMQQSPVEQGGITLFLKPDTALTRPDWPFFVPDWSEQIEYETELVVRINRLGKSIPERFAHRYYDEITLGIDFTARDIQRQLSQKGLPWEIAKGFDGAAYCGQQWLRLSEMPGKNVQDLHFEMQLNGETRQVGWTGDMIHTVDQIIAYASQFYLLKTGDLIFTGTPAGVGRVKEGDLITAQLEGIEVLNCRCK